MISRTIVVKGGLDLLSEDQSDECRYEEGKLDETCDVFFNRDEFFFSIRRE